jgi:hypothetical protein
VTLSYQPVYAASENNTRLNTSFRYYQNQLPDSTLDQKRTQNIEKMEHNVAFNYIEPITKKFKTQVSYNFAYNKNTNNRKTFDYGGAAYDIFNTPLSNNFENRRLINRGGLRLIYDVKKYKISIGSAIRQVQQENVNLSDNQKLYAKRSLY